MAAVVASEVPMSAKKMPYHRRSGAYHRAPVSVISGVIETAIRKVNSPPVPSTSASLRVRTSLAFSEYHPRRMKNHGTNAGRRKKNSAIVRRLKRGKYVACFAIQESTETRLTFGAFCSAYSG